MGVMSGTDPVQGHTAAYFTRKLRYVAWQELGSTFQRKGLHAQHLMTTTCRFLLLDFTFDCV